MCLSKAGFPCTLFNIRAVKNPALLDYATTARLPLAVVEPLPASKEISLRKCVVGILIRPAANRHESKNPITLNFKVGSSYLAELVKQLF